MKSHHALIATLALLAAGVQAAQAQYPARTTNPAAEQESITAKRQKLLLHGITLTPDQQAKVDTLEARYATQVPMMQPGTPPDAAMQDRLRLLFEKYDGELRLVLTADQQKAFDKNRAEVRRQQRPVG